MYVPVAPQAAERAMQAHREQDWPGAIAQATDALPYYEACAEFRRQIELLLIRAHAQRQLGLVREAHEDAQRAQLLLDATWMPLIGARADTHAGDLPYLLAQAHHLGLPVTAHSMAGQPATPDLLYTTARAEYASFRQWDALGHALRAQTAWAMDSGQLLLANNTLREALQLDRSRGQQRGLARDIALVRQLSEALGEPALALRLARWADAGAAPQLATDAPMTRWDTPAERVHALAALRALRHDPARAARPDHDLLAALESRTKLEQLSGQSWELSAEIGLLLLEQGRIAGARRYLDHALGSVEALRAQLATPRQREAHAAAHRDLTVAALHARVGVDTDQLPQADYLRALAMVSRLKARALLDHIQTPPTSPPVHPPELSDALLAEEVADALLPWLRAQRAISPQAQVKPPTRWERPDERVVEYLISQRVGYVWVLHPGGITMRRIAGWQTLGPLVNEWRRALVKTSLTRAEFDRWRSLSERLHVELIGPVEDLIAPATSLIIAPDGPLHDLPFDALARPSRDPEPHYLFESFALRYTTSAAALTRPRTPVTGTQALVLGSPSPLPALPDQGVAAALPGAREEAIHAGQRLAQLPGVHARTLLGAQASEAALRRADLTRLRYLHISTHGVSDALPWSLPHAQTSSQPLLLLAYERETPEDGVVRLTDILRWRTNAELVVLSGCTTGRGWEELGAGAYGLAGAFLVAGAHSVIASSWDVSDEATAALMRGFYDHLARGETPAEALRHARARLTSNQRPPFYWAAFRLII